MMTKMKKIILAAAFLALTTAAGAQSMYDAIAFSQNNYFGTARSMAMGNAVTSLGGDLGSIGINPAGSAVSSYGQFVITPGLTISSVSSAYSPEGENGYGVANNLKQTKMNLPNVGVSMTFETGKRYGVKGLSFAMLVNQTNNFNYAADAFGTNSRTSKIAEFADAAYGISEIYLPRTDNYNPYEYSDVSWDILTAYNGGMFGPYGWDGEYAGVTESISDNGDYHFVPAALAQTSSVTKVGSRSDLVMNFGMNISDRVYIGFNLGVPMAHYRFNESFYEAAVSPDLFPIVYEDGDDLYTTYFQRGYYNYKYFADMGGIYASLGVIVRPTDNLRLGASIQSPTALSISETWQYMASTTYSDNYYDDSETSPAGLWAIGGAFGNELPPESLKLPWRQVTPSSDWVCDENSVYFNSWQERGDPALTESWSDDVEHLEDYPRLYAYACVIEFNRPPEAIPARGCAIFLHCSDGPTGGCVGLPREQLLAVLQWLDPQKQPWILISGTEQ